MCEVLMCRLDKPGSDPARYLSGMAVRIMPDGHKWSKAEFDAKAPGRGRFSVIKFTGVDHEYSGEDAELIAARDKVLGLLASRVGGRRTSGVDLGKVTQADTDAAANTSGIVSVSDRVALIDTRKKAFAAPDTPEAPENPGVGEVSDGD